MKNELLLICSLLGSLSVLVKCEEETRDIRVRTSSGGAKVICPVGYGLYKEKTLISNVMLEYNDLNTGEYVCQNTSTDPVKIFVKFRTCDNCIELDIASVAGLVVGEVVVTFVLGVSVFLIAKHVQTSTTAPNKKGSDKQRLVQHEESNDDDNYQRLRPGIKDVYDKLKK
ncbi:T-cell surface glycoprotein CD3 gamma chain-like [Eucyclogobius newberryi]|uniref:T-cell surface glycoprotein CD3 gamma chain-like n=1 Tax=Eucyclogobius newberryi TaxID=166745 RepID=UPI003B5A2E38